MAAGRDRDRGSGRGSGGGCGGEIEDWGGLERHGGGGWAEEGEARRNIDADIRRDINHATIANDVDVVAGADHPTLYVCVCVCV